MCRLLALACLAISLPITAAAEEFVIGSWFGWEGWDKDDGSFTACSMFTDAGDAATLYFSIQTNNDFVIYLEEQKLVPAAGSNPEIALSLDDFRYGSFRDIIDSKGGFLVRLPYSDGLLRQFRNGRKLKFDVNAVRFSYLLTDAAIAFPRLRECFENGVRGGSSHGPQTVAGSDTSYLFSMRESKPKDVYKVGPWEGWTNRDAETGEFLGCGLGSGYGRLGELTFSMLSGGGFIITLTNPNWRLEKNVKYPVELLVDGRSLGRPEAHVFATDAVRIPLTYSDRLLDVFRKGNILAVKAAQETTKYRLNGTSAALPRLRDCYFANMPRKSRNPFAEAPSGTDNPFKPAPGTGSSATGSGQRTPPPGIEDAFRAGDWTGLPIKSKKTGAYIGCVVRGKFRGGVRLQFVISSAFEFMIGVENPQWRLPATREFPVEVVVDGQRLGRFLADTRKSTKMRIFQDYTRALVARLHNGRVIAFYSNKGKELARYDLAGSSAALTALEKCFFEKVPGGQVSADPFSGDPSDEPDTPPETTTAEREQNKLPDTPDTEPEQTEPPTLRDFVARLLKNAGMDEFHVLGREEREDQAADASNAWTDGKTIGMLLFLDKGGNDFSTAANDAVSRFADACRVIGKPEREEGAFGNGRQVLRWSVTCAGPKGDSYIAMTQIDAEKYLLGFVHLGVTEGVAKADDRLHAYFAKTYQ